ncbi:MAG: thioredoxin family protein [Chitinophagales bacterium]
MKQKHIKKIILIHSFLFWGACQFSAPTTEQKQVPTLSPTTTQKAKAKQPISFMETSLDDALKLAQKSDKIVFVDVYTNWCKPCKEMDKFVFSDAKVGNFFNKNFVNYKLNAQTPTNKKIARKYGVSAYPTLIFVDKNGEALLSSMGYIDAEMLLEYAKEILAEQQ